MTNCLMLNNLVIINNRIVSGIRCPDYDNPTSPETMVPAWIMTLIKNLYNTGEDILDALGNYVNGIWE